MNIRQFKIIFILILSFFFFKTAFTQDKFNFDITEIKILEDGNKFVGTKRGKINTEEILIHADTFVFDKKKNILTAKGNIEIIDNKNKIKILTDEIVYAKSNEIIYTIGNTKAIIQSKYNFLSKNVYYNRRQLKLSSKFKSYITDKEFNEYSFENFTYSIKNELLEAKNINIINNDSIATKNNLFFSSGFFDLQKRNFIAGDTKINFHKEIFGNSENDPRLYGVSSQKTGDLTIINKGIFTSCNNKKGKCPPWSIKAKKITHDSDKKQIAYENAVIQIYNKPILYFPKFFHPDPSVKRQSGFLKPYINKSQVLGSSFQIPYYKVLSENSDLTFKPIIFDKNIIMFNNEYRLKNKYSTLIADFALVNGYKSSLYQSKKNIYHLFTKFDQKLNLDRFNDSNLKISIERTSSDTYLKLFDSNLVNNQIKPPDFNTLKSNIELDFDHNDYQLNTGLTVYEKLNQSNEDKYQFVLPYYNFSKFILDDYKFGTLNLNSFGDNILKDTNNLTSKIINDLNFDSKSFLSNLGFVNNYKIYTKNINTVAKNNSKYKSSPHSEIASILEFNSNFPLIKRKDQRVETLLPKLSLRFNPNEMINYSDEERRININNLFDINRLGLSDTLESGKSLTLGFDYKNESTKDINDYFEFKLGTVIRDSEENNIPKTSTLNNKSSDLFGSLKSNLNKNLMIRYNFSLDNNLDSLNYNSITSQINLKKFNIELSYLKENYENNNENILENSISYELDDNNFFSFKTRKNREIDLTEFYDLIYEYKNDCLVAAIKYKKSFYEDRDVKPSEDLMFTLTLFPISKFEQKIN